MSFTTPNTKGASFQKLRSSLFSKAGDLDLASLATSCGEPGQVPTFLTGALSPAPPPRISASSTPPWQRCLCLGKLNSRRPGQRSNMMNLRISWMN